MDAPGDSAIGGTYVGNPVAQAAALAVLDVMEDENVVERAAQIGDAMRTRMLAWQERFPAIGDVRGLGAMLAIELVEDRSTKRPAPDLATAVVGEAARARAAAPQGRHLLELHPRPVSARAHRPGARRGALGVGGRARSGAGAPSRAGRGNARPVTGGELIDGRYELEELVGSGGIRASIARATRCSSATSRSRSCTSTIARTTTTSSGSSARRAPSRSSRTRTSSPSSTAARTTAGRSSSSSTSTATRSTSSSSARARCRSTRR